MIPRIIHQTAPTKHLSWEERRLARRLRGFLPGWEYRLWDDEDNDGLVRSRFPQYADAFAAISRGVAKADIARYMYLHTFGGFYFDTDYTLFKPIGPEILERDCVLPVSRGGVENMSYEDGFRLGNAVLASAPGYPLWSDFIDYLFSIDSLADTPEHRIEVTTGPDGLSRFFIDRADRYADAALPARPRFHPACIRFGLTFGLTEESYGGHYCFGSWRTKSALRNLKNYMTRKIAAI